MSAGKKAKAERTALARHRASLMLDHIEWMLPIVRAALANMADADILRASEHVGSLIEDPFRGWIWRERKLSEHSEPMRRLEALWSMNLSRVIAGDLPVPDGAWLTCPNVGIHCIGTAGLLTFAELREHLLPCVQAAWAAGKMVSDPFGRITYSQWKHPDWRWRRSDRGRELIKTGITPWLSHDDFRRAPVGSQPTLFAGVVA